MAENRPSTPEQQLLKLIEESRKGGKAAPPPAPAGGPRSAAAIPARFRFTLAGLSGMLARHGKMSMSISDVNRLLTVAAAALAIYLVFDSAFSIANLRRPANFAPQKESRAAFRKELIEPLKEASYYLQKVSSRDIFKEGKRPQPAKVEKTAERSAETLPTQNLALVGISWSSNPDAIIEDKGSKRTFFVKRGQTVGDNMKVEAIFKDHVVLSYQDTEYELR